MNNYTIIDFADYPLYLDVVYRQKLMDQVKACDTEYLFLVSSRKRFVQGADVREFSLPDSYPDMRDVLAEFDKSQCKIITILTGNTKGLGFEIALASDYRCATMNVTCAFPESKMGLIPGSGGTVRLPRLTDKQYADAVISSGNEITSIELWNRGVIDYLYASKTSVVTIIQDILTHDLTTRKMLDITDEVEEEKKLFKKLRNQIYRS